MVFERGADRILLTASSPPTTTTTCRAQFPTSRRPPTPHRSRAKAAGRRST